MFKQQEQRWGNGIFEGPNTEKVFPSDISQVFDKIKDVL